MPRWVAIASLAVVVILAACTSRDDGEPAATATPIPAATSTSEPTPTPTPAATVTVSQLRLEDAPHYLDASAVLPGFRQVDPRDEGFSNADLGLGPEFSEVVLYLSDEPFQLVGLFIGVVSGEIDKAAAKAGFRDEEAIEEEFLAGFLEGAGEGVEPTISWSDPSLGDTAKLASITAAFEGVEVREEFLIFLQEEGREAASVFILSLWLPGEPATVDTLTIGKHISARIANR